MNPTGLATKLDRHGVIFDLLLTGVQVARAPRGQRDSGLLPRLEEAQGSHPEREEQADPPPSTDTGKNERRGDPDAHGEHGDPHQQALPTLSGADVRRAHRVHFHALSHPLYPVEIPWHASMNIFSQLSSNGAEKGDLRPERRLA